MSAPADTTSPPAADAPRRHLLALAGARLPDDLKPRAEGCETTTVALPLAALDELAVLAAQVWDRVTIVAPGWAHLRLAAVPARLLGTTTDLVIRLTQDPARSLQPPGSWLTLRTIQAAWTAAADGSLEIHLQAPRPTGIAEAVQAAIGADTGPLHLPLRVGIADRTAEAFVAGSPFARYVGIDDVVLSAGNHLPAADLVLDTATSPAPAGNDRPRVRILSELPPGEAAVDPAVCLPPVDTWAVNPSGFIGHDHDTAATTVAGDAGVTTIVEAGGRVVARIRPGAPLTRRQLHKLRPLCYVRTTPDAYAGPVDHARLVSQLAAAGIPVLAPDLPAEVGHLLGDEVAAAIAEVNDDVVADSLLREVASVRLRRAALRAHAPGARARQLANLAGVAVPAPVQASVVLVTRRPGFLTSALAQIARQTWERLELVLGLHGDGFDDVAVAAAVAGFPRPVTLVRIPQSASFGEALNAASAVAGGEYLTKWDDDDLYGADHVSDLLLAADYSGATVVGKGSEFIQLDGIGETVGGRNPVNERRVRFVAGGTLLLRRQTLADLGGWRPVPFAVDQALLRMVLDAGGTVYRTHGMGYVLRRHGQGHTWDADLDYFLEGQSRRWPADSWRQRLVLETDLRVRENRALSG